MVLNDQDRIIKTILDYSHGTVSRELVEDVIDLNILLEPDPTTNSDVYDGLLAKWETVLERGDQLVRKYAEALPDRSLEAMQKEFYSFTNSAKYRRTMTSTSVCREVLSSAWKGVGEWEGM